MQVDTLLAGFNATLGAALVALAGAEAVHALTLAASFWAHAITRALSMTGV